MSKDVFGEPREPEGERPLKVKWPLRAANVIEQELMGRLGEEMWPAAPPMIWIEDDEFKNAHDYAEYGELTVYEAMALRDIVMGDIEERYRRQLIVARELGGSATIELYRVACEVEGIAPVLKGPIK